jgi:predicted adenine nucleotide alpha hydrolase (AANH) superfamily ATPase
MRILLHTCCAPCLIYPFSNLSREGRDVTSYYFNPNIHPTLEHTRRLEAVEAYCRGMEIPVLIESYNPRLYFDGLEGCEEKPQRCERCFRVRLEGAAISARDWGFQAFSTTLLVSPYQEHELIRRVGEEISDRLEVSFLYRDWRSGYRGAANNSREMGMYRQKYCGCVFSEKERAEKAGK